MGPNGPMLIPLNGYPPQQGMYYNNMGVPMQPVVPPYAAHTPFVTVNNNNNPASAYLHHPGNNVNVGTYNHSMGPGGPPRGGHHNNNDTDGQEQEHGSGPGQGGDDTPVLTLPAHVTSANNQHNQPQPQQEVSIQFGEVEMDKSQASTGAPAGPTPSTSTTGPTAQNPPSGDPPFTLVS